MKQCGAGCQELAGMLLKSIRQTLITAEAP